MLKTMTAATMMCERLQTIKMPPRELSNRGTK
jgi:hypothetical protein